MDNMEQFSVYEVLSTLLGKAWEFFQLQFPGAPFTFGQMITGTLIILASLNFLGISFGVGDGNQSDFSGWSSFFSAGRGESGRVKPHFTRK